MSTVPDATQAIRHTTPTGRHRSLPAHAGCLSRVPRRVARTVLRGRRRSNALALPDNKLHWVRDVTMGEDASRIATGGGPRIMAGIRNLVLSLLRLAGHTNIAKALRHNARKPKRAVKLVLTS